MSKKLEFRPEKVSEVHEKMIKVLQENKLTVGELVILYGNLGYTLGASIAGYKEKGPSPDELERMYYADADENGRLSGLSRLGMAMMLQGMTVTSWYEDWESVQLSEDTKEKQ